jgi:uncharacterized protein (DUF1501 family)
MLSPLARREFLKKVSQYAALGSAAPLALSLSSMAQATSFSANDYKAVVCVYFYGGNDYANTVVPYDTNNYNLYASLRPTIALDRTTLTNTVLNPAQALPGGVQFALEPNLAPLMPFFANNKMDVLLNIGTLIQPTTRSQYLANSVALPPRLFSHIDQQKFSQSLTYLETSGWGGRLEDLIMSANSSSTFSAISVAGNSLYLSGNSVGQYQVGTNGAVAISALNGSPFGNSAVANALRSIITSNQNQIMSDQITSVVNRSISAQGVLNTALGSTTPFGNLFPTGNSLASQLQIVARMIKANQTLGAKRQVFFVSLGGFDTHDHITTVHPQLMTLVGNAMSAFLTSIDNLNLSQNVLTFTSSDFGRTLTSNGDGTDHGWGSHHFVFGGPITKSKFIGIAPALANNGPDDVGQGRLVPTTAIDQLAYAIGSWLGASATDLASALPNSVNFSPINL